MKKTMITLLSILFFCFFTSCATTETNSNKADNSKEQTEAKFNPNISITLDKSTITFDIPDMAETITATLTGSDNKKVVWSTENRYIATVDENGLVKSVSGGSVKIYATSQEPSDAKAVCEVTIKEPNRVKAESYIDPKSIKEGPVQIIMCGDSTMRTYTPSVRDQTGWGQVLQDFFAEDAYVINNISMGGRSSRSFYTEDLRWPRVREVLENSPVPTYVFIQFAHNDQKTIETGLGRYLTFARNTPNGSTAGTFYDYIERYIVETRELGGIPVLFTPFVRAYFTADGEIDEKGQHNLTQNYKGEPAPRGDYVAAMKEIAVKHDVPVIDLTAMTKDIVEEYNAEDKLKFIYTEEDGTHERTLGALLIAEAAAKGLKDQGILSNYINTSIAPRVMVDQSIVDFEKVKQGETEQRLIRVLSFGDASGKVTITAPEGFKVSTEDIAPADEITIDCDKNWKGVRVYANFTAASKGNFEGDIKISHSTIDVDFGNVVPNKLPGHITLKAIVE